MSAEAINFVKNLIIWWEKKQFRHISACDVIIPNTLEAKLNKKQQWRGSNQPAGKQSLCFCAFF